jgi:carbon-monoxide dehydrogenase medium subunit
LKPPAFAYHRAETREEVDALLAEHGSEAKVLAGGQSLIPILNMRLASPEHLIDINHLAGETASPEEHSGRLVFGALVRQSEVERSSLVVGWAPLLCETIVHVAHPAIRNRGTLVGSIAHADPAAELPAALAVLCGEVVARSSSGLRTISAEEFFAGPLENSLNDDEWAQEVRIPVAPAPAGHAFLEFARRRGDYALCGAAALARQAGERVCLSFSYSGMGEVPARLELEPLGADQIEGSEVTEAVGEMVATHLDPGDDIHASASYRAFLGRRLGVRAARLAHKRLRARAEG